MALPRKGSRIINVNGVEYRWLVTVHDATLHVTIELAKTPGQLLQACFSPFDVMKRNNEGHWRQVRQGRSITSSDIRFVILHGLKSGWTPSGPRRKIVKFWSCQIERLDRVAVDLSPNEILAKELASDQISDLQYDLSLDSSWRKILFAAPVAQRFAIPQNYFAIRAECREHNLHFAAFNDGWAGTSSVVFGITSVEFPELVAYTTNYAAIV